MPATCAGHLARILRPVAHEDAAQAAARLLHTFGSLGGVLSADPLALGQVGGPAAAAHLHAIRDAMLHVLRGALCERPVIGTTSALLDYLTLAVAHRPVEHMRVLYLNGRNHLLSETLSVGCVDEAPIYVRETVRYGLLVGATGILLAHNHPSGDATPSDADRALTRRLSAAAHLFGMYLADHVIVGRGTHFSFRAERLL